MWFLSVIALASMARAHMQLLDPFPLRSPLNSKVPNDFKDYSMTTPLVANGLPYPCKGYLNSEPSLMASQKTWPAGSSQTFTVAPPGAPHGGGSCQLVLSYDMGKTWNVIYSIIGGCMVEELTQTFTIPAEAPSGEVVFGWTWFNRLGNREMYENCAIVTITNGGSGLNPIDHPAPFVANANTNQCTTIENLDPVFPNPGKRVKYSGDYKGTVPPAGKGIIGSNCSDGDGNSAGTRGNTGSSGGGNQNPAPAPSSASTTSKSTAPTVSTPNAAVPTAPAATTSRIATQNLVATPSSSTATPSASSTSKPKKCRPRPRPQGRSLEAPSSPEAIYAREIQNHRQRLVRRPRTLALSHADLARRAALEMQERQPSGRVAATKPEYPVYLEERQENDSGRVAAMKAEYPVYHGRRQSSGAGRVAAMKAEYPVYADK